MAELKLTGVNKIYDGGVEAVVDFHLDIPDGAFVIFVGPSGCGKSTTLRMIAGLEDITGGEIKIGDTVVNNTRPQDRDVAMVFQNYALYPHMTVFENMAFSLTLQKLPKRELRRRVEEAAETLEIAHLLSRFPAALSGGERQRVALGRALVRNPKAFLFDEPLSNLDARLRATMRGELRQLHQRLGTTFIYVTHDQVEAMTMGDVIVIMDEGIIQQAAPPQEIYDRPANLFVATFIGAPPMNLFEGTLVQEGEQILARFGEGYALPLTEQMAANPAVQQRLGKPLTFGMRPTDIKLDGEAAVEGLTMTVKQIEFFGAEVSIEMEGGGIQLTALVSNQIKVREEEMRSVTLKPERLHIFDPETAQSIFCENA
ncbi:MAG: sn-glycerol-3-phosphate ABC transporter ATP-binding protein UgpC [Oscillospiraceae bacterium]|nr:sn-glycerol-3-phosphate ABC transporter ATP-binding protein UgpC [Oscillospiraceae bacterium]